MNVEGLSLDQLRVALAVVDTGSFSAAARRFRRAQSAVSYAIASLEDQLGVVLFDRTGYRPVLTPAGRSMLDDFRAIVARSDDLAARARALARGLEPEVRLVVDAVCSMQALAELLGEFRRTFPSVDVRLEVETLGMVVERTLQAEGAIGVIGTLTDLPTGLTRYALPMLPMAAVAAPSHPLALAEVVSPALLEEQIQIVLSDRSRRTEGRDYAVLSPRTWRVGDLSAKLALLRHGLGWGSMPCHMIEEDLAAGRLKVIRVPGLPLEDVLLVQAFHEAGRQPGPATMWLLERLQAPAGDGRAA
jgi:DNA-binding transcriptional LysR family regulator